MQITRCSWIQDSSMNQNQTSHTQWTKGRLHSAFPTTPAEVSSVEDLFEFICSGPLISKLGLSPEKIGDSIDKWLSYGLQLCQLFELNQLYLTVPQKARFYHYYIPVFLWCEEKIANHVAQFKDKGDIPPLVLEIVNKNLEAYYDAWDKFVKAWVVIKIQDPSCVYQWRLQAEIAMREAGKPGMTDEEVKDFVSRYLPAYNAYLPTLYTEGPSGSDPENLLVIEIDEGRNPIL
ncbi:hypothetical protein Tsubulata_025718, partial [Turnera subulata]